MADQSLDSRRLARQRELVTFNIFKPFIEFQTSLLRAWSEHFEIMASNYERSMEAFTEQQQQRSQQHHQ